MAQSLQALAPLFLLIIPFLFVYSSAVIYRSIYSEETIKKALEKISEYRRIKADAEKGHKRKLKKLKALQPEYKAARGLLLKSTLVKTLLILVTYVIGSLLFMMTMPVLVSPYYIPILTIIREGTCLAPTFLLYFLSFVVFYTIYRDNFL